MNKSHVQQSLKIWFFLKFYSKLSRELKCLFSVLTVLCFNRVTRSTSLSSSSSSRETSWRIVSRRSARGQWLQWLYIICTILWNVLVQQIFICASTSVFRFRATLYPCPETPQERKEMLAGVNARIEDLQMVNTLEEETLTHWQLVNIEWFKDALELFSSLFFFDYFCFVRKKSNGKWR